MNSLRLVNINLHAPYRVMEDPQRPNNYYFVSDGGTKFETAEGKMDGQMNFLAIISRLDNPNLSNALEEFDETISFLFDEIDV